jgi:hypothetical protein
MKYFYLSLFNILKDYLLNFFLYNNGHKIYLFKLILYDIDFYTFELWTSSEYSNNSPQPQFLQTIFVPVGIVSAFFYSIILSLCL